MEEIEGIKTGMALAKGALDIVEFVKGLSGSGVISAHFSWDGMRIYGSEEIVIDKQDGGEPGIWWYSVREKEDYTFVRMPTVQSAVVELLGTEQGEPNPDARYWRWVGNTEPGVIYGGGHAASVKTEFIVIGYKPKALVDHFS